MPMRIERELWKEPSTTFKIALKPSFFRLLRNFLIHFHGTYLKNPENDSALIVKLSKSKTSLSSLISMRKSIHEIAPTPSKYLENPDSFYLLTG